MKLFFLLFVLSLSVAAQEQPKKKFPKLQNEEGLLAEPSLENVEKDSLIREGKITKEKTVRLGNEGGGGEPIAAEFSHLASYLSDYFSQNPQLNPQVSRPELSRLASEIRNALHVSSDKGAIEIDEAHTGTERPPFLEATRSPLFIKISRPQWSMLDEAGRLKATKNFLIDLLNRPSDDEEIPLPQSSLKTYTERYALCVKWTTIIRSTFDSYEEVLSKCRNDVGHLYSPHESNLRSLLVKYVPSCVNSCELSGQKLSGTEICLGYLEQARQLMEVRGKQKPLCIGV